MYLYLGQAFAVCKDIILDYRVSLFGGSILGVGSGVSDRKKGKCSKD